MNINIEKYISQYKLCSELIFEDWDEFLTVLYKYGGKVKAILWFDYCKIVEQHKSLGGGGYRDPKNSEYMWAETQIFDELSNKTMVEVRAYIQSIIQQNIQYHLYPSFFIQ